MYENTDLTVNLIRSCMANIMSPTIGPNHSWNINGVNHLICCVVYHNANNRKDDNGSNVGQHYSVQVFPCGEPYYSVVGMEYLIELKMYIPVRVNIFREKCV